MTYYRIVNRTSGADLGLYEGATEADALDAMARDAGYRDQADCCAVLAGGDWEDAVSAGQDDLIVTPEEAHTITTLKGSHTGTLLECIEWQAEHQGAMADIDGVDISDIEVAFSGDPYSAEGYLTPEEAVAVVEARMADE